jgi:hypothetical protein
MASLQIVRARNLSVAISCGQATTYQALVMKDMAASRDRWISS